MAKLIGTVTHVTGEVFAVDANGSRRALAEGDRLFAGEQLQTGAVGAVAVHLADGGELTLGRDSSMPLTTEILANHATHVDTPDAKGPSQAQLSDVEQIQKAIAAGDDPTKTADPTAAGPTVGGPPGPLGGGHSFVLLSEVGGHVDPVIGFPTAGFGFTPIFPEGQVSPITNNDNTTSDGNPPPPIVPPTDDSISLDFGPGALTFNEANLALGSSANAGDLTQSRSFTVNAPDGLKSLSIGGVDVITNGVASGFPQSFTTGLGGTLTITGYNAQTGVVTYTYTLNGAQNDAPGDGANNVVDHLAVVATNNDGNSASGTVNITITDDVPKAVDDTNDHTASGALTTLTGNVLTNDIQGADRIPTGPIVGGTFVGTYGTLVLAADGTYTYTLNPHDPDYAALNGGGTGTDVFTYTLKDADGDTSQATLTLQVQNNPVVIGGLSIDGSDVTVYEKNLASGTDPNSAALTQHGTFTVTANDGLQSLTIGGVDVIGGAAKGFPQSITTDLGTLTITGYNAATGVVSYTYTLSAAHTDVPGVAGANTDTDTFHIVATDTDGSTASSDLHAGVVDDVPTARPDMAGVTEGGSVIGNVLYNDTLGADGAAPTGAVIGVKAGNDTSQSVTTGLGTSIVGLYGTLVLDANGQATYHANPNSVPQSGAEDVFTYSIRDADGDVSTTTIKIEVTDSGLKASNSDGTTVFENALDLNQTGHDLAPGTVVGSNPDSPLETASSTLVGSVTGGSGALTYSLVGATNGTLVGQYGVIHLNADGSYTYTLTSAPHVDGTST
ncbi:MAG: retention module-containing protein, partial [Pseudomonas sp.]